MTEVLSAETSLMSRVPHKISPSFKYIYEPIYKGEPMSIQALQRTVVAPDYCDVDVQKYREALRRLEKAKRAQHCAC